MTITETKLPGIIIIEPQVFGDERGWFMETYCRIKTPQIDCDFVQDNQSYSAEAGVLRGIHFQRPPMEQAKLVRCIKGAVMDFAVDIRPGSPTYKQWVKVELSAENKKQLFIPRGYGHAFLTLQPDTEFVYKTDNYYSPEHEGAILWSDPSLSIDWDFVSLGIDNPILSEKDAEAPPIEG